MKAEVTVRVRMTDAKGHVYVVERKLVRDIGDNPRFVKDEVSALEGEVFSDALRSISAQFSPDPLPRRTPGSALEKNPLPEVSSQDTVVFEGRLGGEHRA